jgi:hypothetical protein
MILHNVGLSISLQDFGLRALSHAVASAFAARYCFHPVPPISRLIVEGALDNLTAMSLMLILLPMLWISPLFHQAKALTGAAFGQGTVSTCLVDSGIIEE